MQEHTSRATMYGDVALVGIAVFVAMALVFATLGAPAMSDAAASGTDGSSPSQATAETPNGGSTAADGSGSGGTQAHEPGPATDDGDAEHGHDDDAGHGHDDVPTASPGPSSVRGPAHDSHAETASTSDGHDTGHAEGDDQHAGHAGHGDAGDEGHGDGDAGHDEVHDEGHGGHEGGDHEGHEAGAEAEHEGHGEHGAGADHEDHDDGHEDGHDDGGHDHANMYAGCDDEHPETQRLVAEVRHSLEHLYPDPATLIAQGYIPYFDTQIPLGLATEGVGHWLNPEYIDNGVELDPTRPESIITDELHHPIGVMFIENNDGQDPTPVYVNDDGTACSPWHPHTDMPARFSWWFYRQAYDGAAYNDGEVMIDEVTPAMMHVWAVDNPHGVYAGHDHPPAEDRGGLPPPLPGEALVPTTPLDEYLPDTDDLGLDPSLTCPHCPDEPDDGDEVAATREDDEDEPDENVLSELLD